FLVVQIAVAMLCALAVTRRRMRPAAVLILCAVAVADGIAAPYPLYRLRTPGNIERRIASDSTPGSVLELPLGLLDGLTHTGRFDFRAMEAQMTHGRPIVGGMVARLSPRIVDAYREWKPAAALIDASADPSPERFAALQSALGKALAERGVRYVIVNRD